MTSRLCPACGNFHEEMFLVPWKDWTCPTCGWGVTKPYPGRPFFIPLEGPLVIQAPERQPEVVSC
jgi:hypothetical protein